MRTRNLTTAALISLCLLLCCSCSSAPRRQSPTRTQSVEVPVLTFVPVPAELTAATPYPQRAGSTYRALADWIPAWSAALRACNADKASIASLRNEP